MATINTPATTTQLKQHYLHNRLITLQIPHKLGSQLTEAAEQIVDITMFSTASVQQTISTTGSPINMEHSTGNTLATTIADKLVDHATTTAATIMDELAATIIDAMAVTIIDEVAVTVAVTVMDELADTRGAETTTTKLWRQNVREFSDSGSRSR